MLKCLLVGVGGFTGSILRYLLGLALVSITPAFPGATLIINLIGAIGIGALTGLAVPLSPHLMLLLTVGLCGGFTTFSTFSLETINLFEKGQTWLGIIYITLSVALCLGGVIAGRMLVRLLHI